MQVSGKKFLLVLASWLSFSLSCNSQDIQTTPNLINNQWSGVVTGNYNPGGTSGGNRPAFNPSNNTILFGYTQSTVEQSIRVNNALTGSGIRVGGYEWRFEYINSNYSSGSLSFRVTTRDSSGASLQNDSYSLNTSGNTSEWASHAGSMNYKSPYSLSQIDSVNVSFTGKDNRYWAGYYGPQVRNVNFALRYYPDECVINPLSSKSCPNYEEYNFALLCSANSLHDPKCPGYEFTQCSINPLYKNTCPGYQQAMLNLNCPSNALYSPLCPGYSQAYLSQQCSISVFFSKDCPGYAKALFEKTCSENPLSNTACPLYDSAYINQQCTINPLFSSACPMYQQAYFNQQCTANPLFNSGCPGYADAFKKKQNADLCIVNSQSSPSCKGYTTVTPSTTQNTQVTSSPLSVPSVGNEDVAKLLTTPQLTSDPIVNQALSTIQQVPQQSNRQERQSALPANQNQQRTQTREPQTQTGGQRSSSQATQRGAQRDQQDAVMDSLASVPGFSAYEQAKLPDVPFYKAEDIYRRVIIPDNTRAQRALNQRSDRIHREMVDEQYRR